MKSRIVFFGTPEYVLSVLDALGNTEYDIPAVVTQPPKHVGRKQILTPSPVAQWAKEHTIPVFDQSPKELAEQLKKLDAQAGVLAAYGRILPAELVNLFPHGIVNIHPSLLPKYRGASPIEAAIALGDSQTGVTFIKLDEEMDHGQILSQFSDAVLPEDTRVTLRGRLFKKAADHLVQILPEYLGGRIKLREQDHSKATFTKLMKKDHGFIPAEYLNLASQGLTRQVSPLEEKWDIPFIKDSTIHPSPTTIHNFIRAVNPWPGAWTIIRTQNKEKRKKEKTLKLKILRAHSETIEQGDNETILVLDQVQLEGKNPVSWKQFKEGYPEAKW